MEELGGMFGVLIIVFYGFAVCNFLIKYINKNYKDLIHKNESFFKIFSVLLKVFVRYHKIFGSITLLFILFHFYLQFTAYGLSLTGAIAASTMFIQIFLGAYGSYKKKKGKIWLSFHRGIAVVLFITILIHVI